MWDNAPLLRGIANALFGVSVALLLFGAARYVLQLPAFALRSLELTAAPQRVSLEQIEKVAHDVRGNFFTVDLDVVRQAFEGLPWVRKVSVRRKFPWGLQVEIEEQVAMARWNGSALVNMQGEVFDATTDETLPAFTGQPDTSAQVARMYSELNDVLQPMQQHIAQISLSPRFAWQVKLDSGMAIELGREDVQQRLQRFVGAYQYCLAALGRPMEQVDLRYRSGFAVFVPGRA